MPGDTNQDAARKQEEAKLNAIQAEAKEKGELVYASSQGMDQVRPWWEDAKGYVAGASIRWTALQYVASDFTPDGGSRLWSPVDPRISRDQGLYLQGLNGTPQFPDHLNQALGQYDLRPNRGIVRSGMGGLTGAAVANIGSAAEGTHLIRLSGGSGGHYVAVKNEGAYGWRFFDANFGHFRFRNRPAFESFIDRFMPASGYRTLTVSHMATHVTPPRFTGNVQREMAALKALVNR